MGERVQLVPGLPSITLGRLFFVFAPLIPLPFAGYGILVVLTAPGDRSNDGWAMLLLGLSGLGFASCGLILRVLRRQNDAESRAGYTTLRGGYPSLPLVDARSGFVIAEPHERPLARRIARERIRSLRRDA